MCSLMQTIYEKRSRNNWQSSYENESEAFPACEQIDWFIRMNMKVVATNHYYRHSTSLERKCCGALFPFDLFSIPMLPMSTGQWEVHDNFWATVDNDVWLVWMMCGFRQSVVINRSERVQQHQLIKRKCFLLSTGNTHFRVILNLPLTWQSFPTSLLFIKSPFPRNEWNGFDKPAL